MKKGYNYQGKIRKEVWLSESTINKIIKKYKLRKSEVKRQLEKIIESDITILKPLN